MLGKCWVAVHGRPSQRWAGAKSLSRPAASKRTDPEQIWVNFSLLPVVFSRSFSQNITAPAKGFNSIIPSLPPDSTPNHCLSQTPARLIQCVYVPTPVAFHHWPDLTGITTLLSAVGEETNRVASTVASPFRPPTGHLQSAPRLHFSDPFPPATTTRPPCHHRILKQDLRDSAITQ